MSIFDDKDENQYIEDKNTCNTDSNGNLSNKGNSSYSVNNDNKMSEYYEYQEILKYNIADYYNHTLSYYFTYKSRFIFMTESIIVVILIYVYDNTLKSLSGLSNINSVITLFFVLLYFSFRYIGIAYHLFNMLVLGGYKNIIISLLENLILLEKNFMNKYKTIAFETNTNYSTTSEYRNSECVIQNILNKQIKCYTGFNSKIKVKIPIDSINNSNETNNMSSDINTNDKSPCANYIKDYFKINSKNKESEVNDNVNFVSFVNSQCKVFISNNNTLKENLNTIIRNIKRNPSLSSVNSLCSIFILTNIKKNNIYILFSNYMKLKELTNIINLLILEIKDINTEINKKHEEIELKKNCKNISKNEDINILSNKDFLTSINQQLIEKISNVITKNNNFQDKKTELECLEKIFDDLIVINLKIKTRINKVHNEIRNSNTKSKLDSNDNGQVIKTTSPNLIKNLELNNNNFNVTLIENNLDPDSNNNKSIDDIDSSSRNIKNCSLTSQLSKEKLNSMKYNNLNFNDIIKGEKDFNRLKDNFIYELTGFLDNVKNTKNDGLKNIEHQEIYNYDVTEAEIKEIIKLKRIEKKEEIMMKSIIRESAFSNTKNISNSEFNKELTLSNLLEEINTINIRKEHTDDCNVEY